jgi:two-component system, response regulator YesN
MRVVITDDEMLERKAMRKFLNENFKDIEVVGEAWNGRNAIELAEQLDPDLMFIDIKMPGISGLEAVQRIREKKPEIKFIIVSAYDSFDYAKKAMKEGVKEYLLKPNNKEEAIEAITRVCQEIKREKAVHQKQQDSLRIEKENFLLKILQQEQGTVSEKQQRELFPNMKCGFFFVVELLDGNDTNTLKEQIEQLSPFPNITVLNGKYVVSLFVSPKEQSKMDSLLLAKKLQSINHNSIWIGIGYSYSLVDQLYKSYQEALQTLQILKKNKRVPYSLPLLVRKKADRVTAEELFLPLFQGDFQAAWMITKELLEELDQTELYVRIREKLVQEGISMQNLYLPENQSQWKDLIHTICVKVTEIHQANDPIERAKQYIYHHFHETITLEQVSEMVHLSPTYFTKLFRETTDTTFIDFLTEVRLVKAKQLLLQNQLSLKEISYMIGYKDPNYFSRVFKKHFNQSPKQFQKKTFLVEK